MNSASEHNQVLIQAGKFSAVDLEENRQGKYSPEQVKFYETLRSSNVATAGKYSGKGFIISLIFAAGFLCFGVVLYFVGVFDTLQSILGSLFLPVLCGIFILAMLVIFVVVPRQYQASVDMVKDMGTPLSEKPLGEIQAIEAKAATRVSEPGVNRRGHQSGQVTYILQMDSIEFRISKSLYEAIQPKRAYRVFAVKDQGSWDLLSMETLE